MAWGGQWCTSPGYAVVHESVANEFVAECKKAVVELYGPDPKSNPDYSREISAAAVNRLASLIDPKKVVYGGKFDAPARYLDPTIIYPVLWSDKIMQDEIFGPLLPILTYSDLGKLLAQIKSLPKPLAGYVFSRNQQMIDRGLGSLSFGGGAVNQTNVFLFIESMPYGGEGAAVLGNDYCKYGYDSLTHAKSVLYLRPTRYRSLVPALYQRESASTRSMVRLLALRNVREGRTRVGNEVQCRRPPGTSRARPLSTRRNGVRSWLGAQPARSIA